MQPLKNTKDLFCVPHVEADSAIANPVDVLVTIGVPAEFDVDIRFGSRILHRVRDEVKENVANGSGICASRRCVATKEIDLPIWEAAPFVHDDAFGDSAEIDIA